MSNDLKTRKEEFVTGLTGGSIGDIYWVTCISLISYFSYCFLNTLTDIFSSHKALKRDLSFFSFVLDYFLNWLALLLSITTFSDNITSLIYGIALPVIVFSLTNFRCNIFSKKNNFKKSSKKALPDLSKITKEQLLPKRSYLTVYRSQMLVITALAILAVDFHIFPRRFAKCETWGTSLMDLGVGSFVFSMGIVSARKSIWSRFNMNYQMGFFEELKSLTVKIVKSFQDSFTVFLLGIGRLILIKLFNYQEHVSEYGVHWNFFVTLSLLQPMKYVMEFCFYFLRLNNFNILIGLIASFGYEYLLQRNNKYLLNYLLNEENRETIFDKNKEGIFSLIGYFSIYLIGESVGGFLLPGIVTPFNLFKNSRKSDIVEFKRKPSFLATKLSLSSELCLFIYTIFFDLLLVFVQSSSTFLNISRRFANLQYVLFVISYNLNYLIGFKLINRLFTYISKGSQFDDVVDDTTNVPYSLESINNNGMLIFLVSNVLTGLINLTFNTLDMDNNYSLLIMLIYSLTVASVGCIFNYKKVYIKL